MWHSGPELDSMPDSFLLWRLQVGLKADTHERVAVLAARQGKSMSHVISEAVERGLLAAH